jgi:hypothetical protein
MEELQVWFSAALPGLGGRLSNLVEELQKIGCYSVAHLDFVDSDEDLGTILLLIEKRKLNAKLRNSSTLSDLFIDDVSFT